MKVYNYASFAKVFEKGIVNPTMTSTARLLFKPIIDLESCVNKNGKPYFIDSKTASSWYKQEVDIPTSIKNAANSSTTLYREIGTYFNDEILNKVLDGIKATETISDLFKLIKESDLSELLKEDLIKLYEAGNFGDFLGKAFLYAVLQDNTKKDTPYEEPLKTTQLPEMDMSSEIDAFRKLAEKIRKPDPLRPPSTIAPEEMKYVTELFRVYQEKTGVKCSCIKDLDSCPKMKRNFNGQRKAYYLAETIRRSLRDTIAPQENGTFDDVKEEMYDGVVTTEERDYDCGFGRMSAVLEHATTVLLSSNLQVVTLKWIGPGEKKGICHMLVNDERLNWIEGD